MPKSDLEALVIRCIKENLELSGEPVPEINANTRPACDLSGFDSLRTLEVLISIEEKLECELPPDKILNGKKFEEISVSLIVDAIDAIKREAA